MNYFLLALNRSFEFSGRASRPEYWWFFLFYLLFAALLGFASAFLEQLGSIIFLVVFLASIVPSLSVGVRRMHDLGFSGWVVLVSWIPLIGALVFLVLAALPGQRHENRFGSVPEPIR